MENYCTAASFNSTGYVCSGLFFNNMSSNVEYINICLVTTGGENIELEGNFQNKKCSWPDKVSPDP